MPIRRLSSASNNNPLARHVFNHDADEIKKHPWFSGIPWSQLHLVSPPFVPKVRENQSITKYFEDEKDIVSDATSSYASIKDHVPDGADDNHAAEILGVHFDRWKAEQRQLEKEELMMNECSDSELQRVKEHFGNRYEEWKARRLVQVAEHCAREGLELPKRQQKPRKEKKRPRDKVLRDPLMRKAVMEVRKKSAFFGYTYRRPKPIHIDGAVKYRRSHITRPTILPVEERESEEGYEQEE